MDFYIQMGHGMMSMCEELSSYWSHTTTIISPINVRPTRITSFAKSVEKVNGKLLFDPQLYFPRKYHKNLSLYDYWPQDDITNVEAGFCNNIISSLAQINKSINSEFFILPSSIEKAVNERWNGVQKKIIDTAKRYADNSKLLHTIALDSEVLLNDVKTENIIQYVEKWDIEGVYIVCEHPEKYYLVDKPLWLTNLMSLVSGIKRLGKKVIVGYASHQMLCLALGKCDAIASGNFLNVRWFKPERFESNDDDEKMRKATWYYCPQALSEFKIPFLDIAKRLNILPSLSPPENMVSPYSEMLFAAALPSSSGYGEREAHIHYLHCLRMQCLLATRGTYSETKDSHLMVLETAEQLLKGLSSKGIRGQDRDFGEIIDVNRAAIAAHNSEYQYTLSKEWNEM